MQAQTPLEVARQHVHECEERVAWLGVFIEDMIDRGIQTEHTRLDCAQKLLRSYTTLLELSRQHVEQLEHLESRNLRSSLPGSRS